MVPPSSKKPPVGPPSGSVANRTAMAAPSAAVRDPLNPVKSVATKPGQTALIRMLGSVSANRRAYCTVIALSMVFEGA